jgi:hypothetical protein
MLGFDSAKDAKEELELKGFKVEGSFVKLGDDMAEVFKSSEENTEFSLNQERMEKLVSIV